MRRYLIAAAIVLACSSDVRAQVVCQQIGTFTYCDNTQRPFAPMPPMLDVYRPPPTYIPTPGRQVIPEYPLAQPYAPLPGYRPIR
jgi:hypothetical protein